MATAESLNQRRVDRKVATEEVYHALEEYRIDRRRIVFLGNDERHQGGFGVVRKARLRASSFLRTLFGRAGRSEVVAVKEIKLSNIYEEYDLKRMLAKEALVWSRLEGHRGIAKFLGFCADFHRKEAWLISSWEPYGNVNEFISRRELKVPERLSLAYDTIDALAFLHQLDPPVCHGDIKSPNVLVNSECRAVLCDFGLARLYEDSGFGRLESTTGFKGSIPWCSPELLNGQPRTASSDIYAWAWLVWEIMTGELPYEDAGGSFVIIRKILEGPLSQVDGESRLSDCLQLWDLIKRCWAAEPVQRPTSLMCKTTFEYLPRYPPTPESADPHTRSPALLENLGEVESWKGDHKAGLAYLEEALHLYEQQGNDKGIASVLRKQAAMASHDSHSATCMNAASAALEKCRSLQDDIGVADALFWLGRADPNTVDVRRNLEESLNIFRANGNSIGVTKCLQRLGGLYRKKGQPEQALPILEEAINVASRCGDRLGEANALDVLGLIYRDLNHMEQAISAFEKAQDIARHIGWEYGLGICLCRLGMVKLSQGFPAEGEGLLHESVRISRHSDAGWRLYQALYWLGECLQAQGRHEEAISALEESCCGYLDYAPRFGLDLARSAVALAESKSLVGRKEEALALYDRAIVEYLKSGDKRKAKISHCLAAKDAILADMKKRNQGGLHGESFS